MEIQKCKSAIKNKLSFFASFESSIAGMIAPNRFPRCGVPVLCMPVNILAILLFNFDVVKIGFLYLPNEMDRVSFKFTLAIILCIKRYKKKNIIQFIPKVYMTIKFLKNKFKR